MMQLSFRLLKALNKPHIGKDEHSLTANPGSSSFCPVAEDHHSLSLQARLYKLGFRRVCVDLSQVGTSGILRLNGILLSFE